LATKLRLSNGGRFTVILTWESFSEALKQAAKLFLTFVSTYSLASIRLAKSESVEKGATTLSPISARRQNSTTAIGR
jgi:hypothetical protein